MEPLRECANTLEQALQTFSDRLERVRERIEGATRLHQLLGLQCNDNKKDEVLQEIQRLAIQIGQTNLVEKFNQNQPLFAMGSVQTRGAAHALKNDVMRLFTSSAPECPINSQPKLQVKATSSIVATESNSSSNSFSSWTPAAPNDGHKNDSMCKVFRQVSRSSTSETESPHTSLDSSDPHLVNPFAMRSSVNVSDANEEDEEDHSKMADSGLGGCDRCEGQEGSKMKRTCSCQSFEDAAMLNKSNDSDAMDEDEDAVCFGRNGKTGEHGRMSFEPNSHLFSYCNLDMDLEAEVPGIDQKTQK